MPGIEPYQGQPDVDRLIAAMRGEPTDRVPNFEILIEDQHVEKLLGRPAGNTLGVGGDPAKGSEAAEGVRPMYADDYIELCRVIGQDAIAMESLWTPIKRREPDGSVALWNDRSFKSREDLTRIVWPGEAEIEEKLRYIREYVSAASGTGVGVMLLCGCIFQTLYEFVMGMESFMVALLDDRDFVEELLEISTDYWVKFVRRMVAEGIDFLYPADDVAFNQGLFVHPDLFREAWVPRARRIFEPVVSAGRPILFHSDGKIDEIVPDLIDIGVGCISPMDPYGVDYRKYKRKFGGQVSLHGNVDITFPLVKGTPEDVDRDVKAHMDVLKPGGRYMCGSSHSIVNYIRHENFVAMINAIHRYGRY